MQLQLGTDQKAWNAALKGVSGWYFTHCFEWGDILAAEGKLVERLVFTQDKQLIALAQLVYQRLPFGWSYAFCPRGPVFVSAEHEASQRERVYSVFCDYLRKKGILFFRFEPKANSFLPARDARLIKANDVNPRATTLIDLGLSTDLLLERMHSKTRYNIRLAEKKNIQITEEKNLELFLQLSQTTAERDGFRLHERAHYEQVLGSAFARQLIARVKNTPIATVVLVDFGDTMTYLYGASDYRYRALMAPYLLQWEAIQAAKTLGYRYYDFFGIAPQADQPQAEKKEEDERAYDPKHQYAGVTRFKLGFGGRAWEAPGTYDLILTPGKYRMYQLLRVIRRWF